MTDLENRLREVEGKRGAMLLEYEKDKAKWSLEKDHFNSKTGELQENVERLEKKIETLLRENEKLKNDKNNTKRSTSNLNRANQSGINNSILGGIKDSNTTTFIPSYKDKEGGHYERSKPYNMGSNIPQSTNPYQKDFNKLFEGIDMNSSRIGSDKSFEKYDSTKFDKYDSNPYNKYAHKFSIRPTNSKTSSSSTNPIKLIDEENGNPETTEK